MLRSITVTGGAAVIGITGVLLAGYASTANATAEKSATPTESVSATAADPSSVNLEALSKMVAAATSNGTVAEGAADSGGDPEIRTEWANYTTTVDTGSGKLTVAAELDASDGGNLQAATENCVSTTSSDGKSCKQLNLTGDSGAWLYAYDNPIGREMLWVQQTLPSGKSLAIIISNYTETSSDQKQVGPSIEATGLNLDAVAGVLRQAGFTS